MELKRQLYSYCEAFVEQRYEAVNNTINELQHALTTETKSTAGDKHETGRAMLQLEREKAGKQLAEIMKLKEVLAKMDIANTSQIVSLGSVVYTTQANYFIAISAGEIRVKKEGFYAISPNTPIGRLLIGKNSGDEVSFRGQTFKIIKLI